MSETKVIYDAEGILRIKLAQFGAVIRHLLSSENLSDEGQQALALLAEKCEHHNVSDCIGEPEFEKCGLRVHLTDWERAGFRSAHEYAKARGTDRPQIKDSDFLPKLPQ